MPWGRICIFIFLLVAVARLGKRIRSTTEARVFRHGSKSRLLDLNIPLLCGTPFKRSTLYIVDIITGRIRSKVTRSRTRQGPGDAGRGQSAQTTIATSRLFQLPRQQTTLGSKGVERREGGRDFAVIVFDAWRGDSIPQGLVGGGTDVPWPGAVGHDQFNNLTEPDICLIPSFLFLFLSYRRDVEVCWGMSPQAITHTQRFQPQTHNQFMKPGYRQLRESRWSSENKRDHKGSDKISNGTEYWRGVWHSRAAKGSEGGIQKGATALWRSGVETGVMIELAVNKQT